MKSTYRTYSFEFSCVFRQCDIDKRNDGAVVPRALEGAHFFVSVDLCAFNWLVEPPNFAEAAKQVEDLIDNHLEGCPILASNDPMLPTDGSKDASPFACIEELTLSNAFVLAQRWDFDDLAGAIAKVGKTRSVYVSKLVLRRAGDEHEIVHIRSEDA